MKKIKVLEIIPSLYPVGGGQTLFTDLCEFFAKHLNEYIDLSILFLYKNSNSFLDERIKLLGVKTIYLNKRKGFDFKNNIRLRRAIKEIQPDIIHSHLSSYSSLYFSLLFRRKPTIIHTVHHIVGPEFLEERFFIKLVNKKYLYPICVCKTGSVSLERYVKIKVPFINNGIDLNNYKSDKSVLSRSIDFLCVASFTDVKNHKYLFECIKLYHQKFGSCHVHCLGDGLLLDECKDYAQLLGIDASITFHGNVNNVNDFMADSKILLVPSKSEANPMVINEAIVSGMYVVANNVGGVRDIICKDELGVLVDSGDKNDFTKKMNIVSNSILLEKFRLKKIKELTKYDISKCAETYYHLFCEVLSK